MAFARAKLLRATQNSEISDDGVGLSAVHIADALGARVVAVDPFDEKPDLARDLGASAVVNAEEVESVPGEIREITNGGANVSVDALGIAETCRNSVSCLRKLGQHVQIGLTTKEEGGEVSIPTDMMVFVGSFGMQPARYDEIFSTIEAGKIDPSKVVSERVPLEATSEKLAAMTEFDTVGIPVIDEF